MSIEFSTAVWQADLPPASKLVILALADFANSKGEAWPAVKTLGLRVGLSERHVQRILRQLVDRGFIDIDTGRGRGNVSVYRLRKGDIESIKGDTGDTLLEEEKVTPMSEKVTSETEKVTPMSEKVTPTSPRSIRSIKEPSGTVRGKTERSRDLTPEVLAVIQAEEPDLDIAAFAGDYLNWSGSEGHRDKVQGFRNQLRIDWKRKQFTRRNGNGTANQRRGSGPVVVSNGSDWEAADRARDLLPRRSG